MRQVMACGAVRGRIAHHSLRAADLDQDVCDGLTREAARGCGRPRGGTPSSTLSGGPTSWGPPIAEYVPDRLVRGRMVRAGDAAHVPSPMTGRGFGSSLDDAAALARHLRDADGNSAPGALADYEAERLAPAQGLGLSGQAFTWSFAPSA
ncbi:FAD-dependent monooxygenase [Streptomyces avermitilis]|uniref:FAD-dependent oxidoreductase n=2 Tax=Streptomyces avermitilis TaxID=33903 RepID=UPI0033AAFA92